MGNLDYSSNSADRESQLPIVRYEWVDDLEDYVCVILERRRIDGTEVYVGVVCQINDWRIQILDQSYAEELEDIRQWVELRLNAAGPTKARGGADATCLTDAARGCCRATE